MVALDSADQPRISPCGPVNLWTYGLTTFTAELRLAKPRRRVPRSVPRRAEAVPLECAIRKAEDMRVQDASPAQPTATHFKARPNSQGFLGFTSNQLARA